jgi:hypothetical protein
MAGNVKKSDYAAFMADLVAFLETFPILGSVFDRRREILNRADFVEKLTQTVDGGSEVRFTELEFLKPTDSDTEGDDDCPVLELTVGVHLFHQFNDSRSDGSNSSIDFVDAVLTIRDAILNRREFAGGDFVVEVDPIEADDFAQFGDDQFTGSTGHTIDFSLLARFYDA